MPRLRSTFSMPGSVSATVRDFGSVVKCCPSVSVRTMRAKV